MLRALIIEIKIILKKMIIHKINWLQFITSLSLFHEPSPGLEELFHNYITQSINANCAIMMHHSLCSIWQFDLLSQKYFLFFFSLNVFDIQVSKSVHNADNRMTNERPNICIIIDPPDNYLWNKLLITQWAFLQQSLPC